MSSSTQQRGYVSITSSRQYGRYTQERYLGRAWQYSRWFTVTVVKGSNIVGHVQWSTLETSGTSFRSVIAVRSVDLDVCPKWAARVWKCQSWFSWYYVIVVCQERECGVGDIVSTKSCRITWTKHFQWQNQWFKPNNVPSYILQSNNFFCCLLFVLNAW